MRGAVGEMHMHVLHTESAEQLGEIPRVARSCGWLVACAVALTVIVDQGTKQPLELRVLRQRIQHIRRWRVMNLRIEPVQPLMPETVRWSVQRAHFQLESHALQGQHLAVAEGLRHDGIAAEEIGDARLRKHVARMMAERAARSMALFVKTHAATPAAASASSRTAASQRRDPCAHTPA